MGTILCAALTALNLAMFAIYGDTVSLLGAAFCGLMAVVNAILAAGR